MNTDRSKTKAIEYLNSRSNCKRKTQRYEKTFNAAAEKVFHQFCPTRECDWIDGWECDLVYTSTGYVEDDCIFTTPETNSLGPGLWIFTRYEPDERVELVRIINESVVIHFRITLVDNGDGTCTGKWNLTYTALNEQGNAMVNSVPEKNPQLLQAIDGLDYFLETGTMMTV